MEKTKSKKEHAGIKNLIPFSERTKEEARELGRKGGKASGRSRAFAKNFREALQAECEKRQGDGKDAINGYEMAANALLSEIADGNVQAMRLLADMTGQITQQIEMSGVPKLDINILGGED